jgi:hypothetical protein
MALECFKILNKLSPPCLNDLVVLKNSKYSFRYSNIVAISRVITTHFNIHLLFYCYLFFMQCMSVEHSLEFVLYLLY